jgi:5-methylcytosine-specific restriction enzyme subunit McrC
VGIATLQVFEHSVVRIGDPVATVEGGARALGHAEHAALAGFADRTRDRYFGCGRRTIRFGSYVGLIQVGDIAIEVLPKIDRHEVGGEARWHSALVRMLRQVGDLGLESADEAELRTHPGRLFELFVRHFLDSCERLLRDGLAKTYRASEENSATFRGRLLIGPHIRANAADAARFYVEHSVYDHRSLENRTLHEALWALDSLPLSPYTRARARTLRNAFPEVPRWVPDADTLARWRPTRNTLRYATALRLASLLLFGVAADVRRGSTPLLALMFDMNALWERYIAAVAQRALLEGDVEVHAQDSRAFWRGRSMTRALRPDLTLRRRGETATRLVVDTKWKVPPGGQPSSADLKQMFCYHELYDCSRSLLLYPSSRESHVASAGRFVGREHECSLAFLSVHGDCRGELGQILSSAIGRS